MADVLVKSLGEQIPTENWQVKGFEATWRDQSFLLLVSSAVMQKASERSYASTRIAPSIWSMTEKSVLEEAASRKLARDGLAESGQLALTLDDID